MQADDIKRYREKVEPIAKKLGVSYLAVFGSFARGDYNERSDVDVLVDFDGPVTFDGYFDLEFALEKLFGRKVDLITRGGLSKYVSPYIQNEVKVLYD